MSNTPTDDQAWQVLLEIPEQENEQAVVGVFARAVLAKWGTPQPAPAPLSDEVVKDAELGVWRTHPAFFVEYQIDDMKLYRDVYAARARLGEKT